MVGDITAMESAKDFKNQYSSYGQKAVGFGNRLAVLVVDFQRAFTDAAFSMGGAQLVDRAVTNTQRLLAVARNAYLPVATCIMGYGSQEEMPFWKVAACQDLILGKPECEVDPRISNPDYDLGIIKNGPSIFFQTPVMTFLIKNRVDTVVITGCVTSGCVRASIIDSFQYGFRTIVPEDCVGDYDEIPHRNNLRDVERRYADISSADCVIQHIERNH